MAKKQYVQDHKPEVSAEARAWLKEEIAAQEARFADIVAEQEALTPEREKWYADFLQIIQTKGFNVTGDTRRVIGKDEIPERPDRDDAMKVVW
ncbi:MAG: hypothetical protein AB8G16_13480 [Gammaproteobacteria bacterium]